MEKIKINGRLNVGAFYQCFQCEGKEYNHKSDVWAMGCILYEMASRQKTFEGSNLPALVNKIMKVCESQINFNENLFDAKKLAFCFLFM